jgi:endopeptidase La
MTLPPNPPDDDITKVNNHRLEFMIYQIIKANDTEYSDLSGQDLVETLRTETNEMEREKDMLDQILGQGGTKNMCKVRERIAARLETYLENNNDFDFDSWISKSQSSCIEEYLRAKLENPDIDNAPIKLKVVKIKNYTPDFENDDLDESESSENDLDDSSENKRQRLDKFRYLLKEKDANDPKKDLYLAYKSMDQHDQINTIQLLEQTRSKKSNEPLLLRILKENHLTPTSKRMIMKRLCGSSQSLLGGSESSKSQDWINAITSLPIGKMAESPISPKAGVREIRRYLKVSRRNMDKVIYGHSKAKDQVMRILASMIGNSNNESSGNVLAIQGPPGVGKTAFVKRAIAKALGRPFAFISLGGMTDSSYLEGHDYTYQGARYGRMVEILLEADAMNPVIFFDELDKVSNTPKGMEIINSLMHLVDPTQNQHFRDKYLGFDLDFSQATFVFSLNNLDILNPILRDRLKVISVSSYLTNEKINIVSDHLMDEIHEEAGIKKGTFDITENASRCLIETYTNEGGVRRVKELVKQAVMELWLRHLENRPILGQRVVITPKKKPFLITQEMLQKDIFLDKHPYRWSHIPTEATVGLVNGLWANVLGLGGLIPIQARWNWKAGLDTDEGAGKPERIDLRLTGLQGDVMKESMTVALSLATNYLQDHMKGKLLEHSQKLKHGIHIHCPEGGVKKDGPSAGTAITIAILSLILNKRVDHTTALTGEIDLRGNITAIGGLQEKIFGAIRAGVKRVLFPVENQIDLDSIRKDHPNVCSELDNIELVPVKSLEKALDLLLV